MLQVSDEAVEGRRKHRVSEWRLHEDTYNHQQVSVRLQALLRRPRVRQHAGQVSPLTDHKDVCVELGSSAVESWVIREEKNLN